MGEEVYLEPKIEQLLHYLVSRSGQVISRAELLDSVWSDVTVGDEVITNAIAKLRRLLGDNSKNPELIETIPKRGYRIVASASDTPTGRADQARPPRHWRTTSFAISGAIILLIWFLAPRLFTEPNQQLVTQSPEIPSLAVLPFANLNDDAGQDYIVDGVTVDLIASLSRLSGLRVTARSASFAYKGAAFDPISAGQELGVRYLVQGSIRLIGAELRVDTQLIDVDSGQQIWNRQYTTDASEIIAIRDKITLGIAGVLSINYPGTKLDQSAPQQPNRVAAYQDFVSGQEAFRRGTPEDFVRAIAHFENAISEDPDFAGAHAALAAVFWESYRRLWTRRLGNISYSQVRQLAETHLEKSLTEPSSRAFKTSTEMLLANRRFDEATIEAERAIAVEPNGPLGYVALAQVRYLTGSPAEAEDLLGKAMRLDDQDQFPYLLDLGMAQLGSGANGDAVLTLERATQRNPDNRLAWNALLSAYGSDGQVEKAASALTVLNELQKHDKLISFSVATARERWRFKNIPDEENYLDGLRKAGVPEW